MTSRSGKNYFYHNDHLGVPHSLTDTSGRVVWQSAFDVYGDVKVVTQDVTNNLRFPGQYFDGETGLYYNWHRFYDPGTGRYISADPIGLAGGVNLFAYVENNPINYTDPKGLFVYRNTCGDVTCIPVWTNTNPKILYSDTRTYLTSVDQLMCHYKTFQKDRIQETVKTTYVCYGPVEKDICSRCTDYDFWTEFKVDEKSPRWTGWRVIKNINDWPLANNMSFYRCPARGENYQGSIPNFFGN